MLKRLLTLTMMLCFFAGIKAETFPTVSDDENSVWYIIQFMNGGKAFTANSSGAKIKAEAATGSDAQLWKISGNETDGYTLVNKKGLYLYVNSANKEQMVYSSSEQKGVSKFNIGNTVSTSYAGAFEIHPKGNSNISMNLWGGVNGTGEIGLWDKNASELNNSVKFISEAEFNAQGKISIVPYPLELNVVKEGSLQFGTLKSITYPSEEVKDIITEFASQLQTSSGIALEVKASGSTTEENSIHLTIDETLHEEGYTLTVNDNGIAIKASKRAGFLYAIQTLKQMLPREYFDSNLHSDADWSVLYLDIKDQPALGHRGFMLDIARHYFDKDEVKKILSMMALYKMNRFHWHLTDDQGWRIEIPEYPRLTEVGSIRAGSFSNNGDGTKFFDDTEYGRGMWYSQEDLKEVVAYAKSLNIEIIPEVDLPGHMVAAVASYPEFSCDPTKSYEVRIDGGISKDVLNIGDDRVIDFLKCVLDNLAEIFPYPVVHIGGDECPTDQWSTNAQCLQRVKDEGLSSVNDLQAWLVEELGIYVKEKHGKDLLVWDELLKHWNSSNTVKPIIMAWNHIDKSAEAANHGFKCIVVPYQTLYIDFMQVATEDRLVDEPYYGGWGDGWVNTLQEVYEFNPLASLGGREDYCLGVQGNMWTETCNDEEELEYQLFPRLIALSETGWLPAAKKSWGGFYRRLQSQDEILEYKNVTYAKHYIEPTEYTAKESAQIEANSILFNAVRGGVGYAPAEYYDALQAAVDASESNEEEYTANLVAAIAAYKNADIVQPTEGKKYQIISASTYYKRQYEGSTVYAAGNGVRFHYTPQLEPEEIWTFVPANGGYIIKNAYSDMMINMPSINSAVTLSNENGTAIRIDKATIATSNYTYLPGVVNISAVSGYSANVTGNVKRLYGEQTGIVHAKDDAKLCYPGTWKIVEITNFTDQLAALVAKCTLIAENAEPGEIGEPTEEALEFLQSSVIDAGNRALEAGEITEEQYDAFAALYHQFLAMPRASINDAIREDVYYYIRNAYFTDYYAANNSNVVTPLKKGTTDKFLWSIKKNADGSVYIYNKANGKAAYINSDVTDQKVLIGKEYGWTLTEGTTDIGDEGIFIVGKNGVTSWYTNPSNWNYVLTKPYWGACIWLFEESGVEVATSIIEVQDSENIHYYDLQGRKVENPGRGLWINSKGEKIFIK